LQSPGIEPGSPGLRNQGVRCHWTIELRVGGGCKPAGFRTPRPLNEAQRSWGRFRRRLRTSAVSRLGGAIRRSASRGRRRRGRTVRVRGREWVGVCTWFRLLTMVASAWKRDAGPTGPS